MQLCNLPIISQQQVMSVNWTGNYITYDLALCMLGKHRYNKFIIVNPDIDRAVLKNISHVPNTKLCTVWYYKGTWLAKMFTDGWTQGYMNLEVTLPEMSNDFDVVFISYGEHNAEENWTRVLHKSPSAKRVNNITGILEAHTAAAAMATTDMFYIVDGDAYLLDDWEFDFQPSIINRNAVHVWHSQNPINDLQYGYGGIKLFPKDAFNNIENTKPLDVTLSVAKRLVVIDQVSNITSFDTDPFSVWKSAVRECTKLLLKTDTESAYRLSIWSTIGSDRPFGEYAIAGAKYARQLAEQGVDPILVNDRAWLRSEFDRVYNKHI